MYFDSLGEFLQMGSHAPWVWSAYGISLVLVVSNLWLAARAHRNVRARLAQWVADESLREKR